MKKLQKKRENTNRKKWKKQTNLRQEKWKRQRKLLEKMCENAEDVINLE